MTQGAPRDADSSWNEVWSNLDLLRSEIRRSKAVNVNSAALRDQAQQLVQLYFREARPQLVAVLGSAALLEGIDAEMQTLLRLAQGRNPRSSYEKSLRSIGAQRASLAVARERAIGTSVLGSTAAKQGPGLSAIETRIIATLESMLPGAAESYRQVLQDLSASGRTSFRGTAVELREVVREVLDHLAPDQEVAAVPGFKLEKDRLGPTMRQKARFILASRGVSASALKAPQDAASVVDEVTASFVRSTYERGSASTHSTPSRQDAERLKMYVDTVLMELLEVS